MMSKRPHLCQFEIKDHCVVWTSAENVPSNLFHLHICRGPSVCFSSCKWSILLLMWGFMWRLTAQHTACVCRVAGSTRLPFVPPSHPQVGCHLHYWTLLFNQAPLLPPLHVGLSRDAFPPPTPSRYTFINWNLFGSVLHRHQRVDHEPHLATSPSYPSAAKHPSALMINSVTTLSFNLN